jgi:hypothetical protein
MPWGPALATGFGDNVVIFIIHDDDVHVEEFKRGDAI